MNFPENYFDDEVREGFFITSMMKRCWAAQLEVLEEIDKVCQKYNIKYFGDCGTLLGAVRHGGFIPWDDDLDICLLREDYELLLKHVDELPETYEVLNWRNRDDWTNAYSRIVNSTVIRFDEEFMKKYHGFPYADGVDIFVLDYMYEDNDREEERRARVDLIKDLAMTLNERGKIDDEISESLNFLENRCGLKIDYNGNIVRQLYACAEKAITEVKRKDASKVCFFAAWLAFHSNVWEKKFCDQIMRVPFECTTIPIPVAYDPILKAHYGDYMKVVRTGGAHEYPGYAKQEKVLVEQNNIKTWSYIWNKDEISLGKRLREERRLQRESLTEKIKKIEALIAASPEVYGGLQPQIDSLKQNFQSVLSDESGRNREVVFITLGPRYWKNNSYFWKKETETLNTDVFVIPISFFDTSLTGEVLNTHYEPEGYTVPVTSYKDYDISKRHPDRIYVQCPYDDINPALTIHSAFYSKELLKYTDELIYVPMYDIKEFNSDDEKSAYALNFTAKTPVVLHADKIILPTVRLKEEYIKALVDFSNGETDEAYWNAKIYVEDYMPDKQSDNFKKAKKTLLYFTDVSPIALYGDKALKKIRTSLELMRDASDKLNVIWLISENMKSVLNSPGCKDGKKLYGKFINIIQEFKKGGWGILAEHVSDVDLDEVDAFAGNPSPYAHYLNYHKKPVMILKDYDD